MMSTDAVIEKFDVVCTGTAPPPLSQNYRGPPQHSKSTQRQEWSCSKVLVIPVLIKVWLAGGINAIIAERTPCYEVVHAMPAPTGNSAPCRHISMPTDMRQRHKREYLPCLCVETPTANMGQPQHKMTSMSTLFRLPVSVTHKKS